APALIKNNDEARYAWQVTPLEDLAENAQIEFRQGPGLISAKGDEPGMDEKTIQTFATYPAFTFLGVVCRDKENKEVIITPDKPQTTAGLCNPLQPVALSFSAPVLRSEIKDNVKFTPDLSGGRSDYNPWGDINRDYSFLYMDRRD